MVAGGAAFDFWIVGCALLTTSAVLLEHWRQGLAFRLDEPGLFLVLLVFLSVYYSLETSQTLDGNRTALTFLGGMASGGALASILLYLLSDGRGKTVACLWGGFVLWVVVISLYPASGREFSHYLGQPRLSGPWRDPNHYGVFMALGVVVEIALIHGVVLRWLRSHLGQQPVMFPHLRKTLGVILGLLLALILSMRGLMLSYSRGAWLACAVGVAVICWQLRRLITAEPGYLRLKAWFTHAWPRHGSRLRLSGFILLTLGAGTYGHLKDLPLPWTSRALSLTNPYDLSWTNRVAAWQGGLHMMAMHAPYGVGWGDMLALYEDYHRPLAIRSPQAIQTNDYAVLGCILGLPGLLCLAGYAMGCLHRGRSEAAESSKSEPPVEKYPDHKNSIFVECSPAIFRALAVALLCACGTNGVILTWPFGVLLWMALAAGRSHCGSFSHSTEANSWFPGGPRSKTAAPGSSRAIGALGRKCGRILSGMRKRLGVWTGILLLGAALYCLGTHTACRIERRTFPGIPGNPAYSLTLVSDKMDGLVTYVDFSEQKTSAPGSDSRKMAGLGLPILVSASRPIKSAVPPECTVRGWPKIVDGFRPGADPRPAWIIIGKWRSDVVRELAPLLQQTNATCVYVVNEWEPADTISRSPAVTVSDPMPSGGHIIIVSSQIVPADAQERIRQDAARWGHGRLKIDSISLPGADASVSRETYLRRAMEVVSGLMVSKRESMASISPKEQPLISADQHGAPRWISFIYAMLGTAVVIAVFRFGLKGMRCCVSRAEKLWAGAALTLVFFQVWVHWGLPMMPPSRATLWLAGEFLVSNKARVDWTQFVHEEAGHIRTIGAGMENFQLAVRERKAHYQSLDDEMFRRYLLSGVIDECIHDDSAWRGMIWWSMVQWTRQTNSPGDAARLAGSLLSERLTLKTTGEAGGQTVEDMWRKGAVDENGFQRLYVAALRSIGIASRLDERRRAEFWTGDRWAEAPMPLLKMIPETGKPTDTRTKLHGLNGLQENKRKLPLRSNL